MKFSFRPETRCKDVRSGGMTLLELLIVIAIIGLLAGLLIPTMGKMIEIATATKDTGHAKQIAFGTNLVATDLGGRLPSPEYPGGMLVPDNTTEDEIFPKFWNFGGTGLWLDGCVFGKIYLEAFKKDPETGEQVVDTEAEEANQENYGAADNGAHLQDTIFISTASVKADPTDRDYHHHSYAMNANIRYDRLYDNVDTTDPYLTEKTLSNIVFSPNAMLFIENDESNVVMATDLEAITQTIENRWGKGGKAITVYLDGHADRLRAVDIPSGDPEGDREASRFWRGVDPDR